MDRIVDHILAFEGEGKIKDFIGNFSEYREAKSKEDSTEKSVIQKQQEPSKENIPLTPDSSNTAKKKKLSFKEQRELETIEKEMPELEDQRKKILDQLNNESDYEKISKLSADLENISEQLENHEMRWLELQEILGEG
jgi:ATP-binding cassette subfamily F protein uup